MVKKASATNPTTAAVNAVISCIELQDVVQGQKICSEVLARYPNHPDLLHLQGVLHKMDGNVELAISTLQKAIAVKPTFDAALYNLAFTYQEAGNIDAAIKTYERLSSVAPNHYMGLFNLADLLHKQGYLKEAVLYYRRFIPLQPRHSQGYSNLAAVLIDMGNTSDVLALCKQAVAIDPRNAFAYNNMGIYYAKAGMTFEARQAFSNALAIDPHYDSAAKNLAMLLNPKRPAADAESLFTQGNELLEKGQAIEAAGLYRQALALNPSIAEARVNLGMALNIMRQYGEAEIELKRAIALRPEFANAHFNLGNVYKDQNQYAIAIKAYEQAVKHAPDILEAWVNLGKAHEESGNAEEAIKAYEQVLTINPNHAHTLAELAHRFQHRCEWDRAEPPLAKLRNLIMYSGQSAPPFLVALLGDPQLEYVNAKRHAQKTYGAITLPRTDIPLPRKRRQSEKLRIGYLSADFHHHATSFLLGGLFAQHDLAHFEIYAYSYGKDDQSAERKRIVGSVGTFRDCQSLSDKETAKLIQDDGIDILVDLKAYTQHGRLGILAYRPAPIQVHYLGYPSTTGADFVDYFIADPVTTPPEMERYFSEKVVRLPDSYQINDALEPIGSAPTRSACGLPDTGIVFCNFNQAYKITKDMFAIWMKLLQAIPGSVMWLYETQPQASDTLRREAENAGIEAHRLVFAKLLPRQAHLARLNLADLFLDTCPVNAHTTASDALRVALPIVTLKGVSFASRVAASLLSAIGHGELAVENSADYESLVLALAQDEARLQTLRQHIAAQSVTSHLFNTQATTRHIEAAYRQMAALHDSGKPPASFNLAAE